MSSAARKTCQFPLVRYARISCSRWVWAEARARETILAYMKGLREGTEEEQAHAGSKRALLSSTFMHAEMWGAHVVVSFWWCESLSFKICCFFSGQGWWSDHDDVGQCLRAPSQVFRYFSEERTWKMFEFLFKLTLTEFTESQNDTKERTELKHSQKQCQVFNRKMVLVIKAHWNYLGGDLRKCNFGSMGFYAIVIGVVWSCATVNICELCYTMFTIERWIQLQCPNNLVMSQVELPEQMVLVMNQPQRAVPCGETQGEWHSKHCGIFSLTLFLRPLLPDYCVLFSDTLTLSKKSRRSQNFQILVQERNIWIPNQTLLDGTALCSLESVSECVFALSCVQAVTFFLYLQD